MLVDSHCHLDKLKFRQNSDVRGSVKSPKKNRKSSPSECPENLHMALIDARARGVGGFLCIGTDTEGFGNVLSIAESSQDIWCSAGIHPLTETNQEGISETNLFDLASSSPKVVAVGECGLDYYYRQDRRQLQLELFEKHLRVAIAMKKPVIVHTREARDDTMRLLETYVNKGLTGVLHCFTESLDMALRAVNLGFYISFSGIITFNNADPLREVVRALPLNRMLVETDSPYLAPVPHRGKSNLPQWVVEVAETVACIKNCSSDEVAKATTDNFKQLFNVQLCTEDDPC